MTSDGDLEGRSVVVNGAGSGIGRASALGFAALGAKVVVADRDAAAAAQVVKTISYAGGAACAVIGDPCDPRVVDEVVTMAVGAFGGLDVLVDDTGIPHRTTALADTRHTDATDVTDVADDAEWRRVIEAGLTAPYLLIRAALPHMLAKGRGAIVLTVSEAGLRGGAAGAACTAVAHGVVGLVKSLAVRHRDQGIRANAIAAPGGAGADPSLVCACGAAPSGRAAESAEHADVVLFLASEAARNINGVVLPVDNGRSAA
ncbi:SDR family oxidoreductase [Streptomyces sp. NBC_01275]|uniref:SDR family NAD(P)-dependent oxidoreductase n=1 Tax=Streptomyces sp. NBC_01275 TaxID=2903807 RepID=UPI00225800A4|nr:SDR family oxidoreductase [Streptomyces sp. NBC_01275]MCX4767738.1 SDR family oxidoreductase [Streptomyces sp. NBC_01275]